VQRFSSEKRNHKKTSKNSSSIFIRGILNDVVSISGYITSNGKMINELKRIWKEEAVA
jgi:hypothetical protein